MELFLLITWILIAVLFNVMPFFAHKKIYKFYRNILYARYSAFLFMFILILSVIAMAITNHKVGDIVFKHKTILASLLILVVILFISVVGYLIKGEGLYSEGLLMNGYLFEYNAILSYHVMEVEKKSHKTFYIYTKSMLGLDIIRSVSLPADVADRFDKELYNVGIIKTEEE